MTTKEKLAFIIKNINTAENLTTYEFNHSDDIKQIFRFTRDESELQERLNRELPYNANNFFDLKYSIIDLIKINSIELELANTYINGIENYYTRNWNKISIVEYAIERNEVELAKKITLELPDEDSGPSQYVAQRKILMYYADKGDLEEFKIQIIKSKLSLFPKLSVESLKSKFIEGFAKKNDIEKTFSLIEEKYFINTPAIFVLKFQAHHLSISKINLLLERFPRIEKQTVSAKAQLYVSHYREKERNIIEIKEFENVINEILKIDENLVFGDITFRDSLLIDLGVSTLSKTQALECKRIMKTTRAKKELNYDIKYYSGNKKYII